MVGGVYSKGSEEDFRGGWRWKYRSALVCIIGVCLC